MYVLVRRSRHRASRKPGTGYAHASDGLSAYHVRGANNRRTSGKLWSCVIRATRPRSAAQNGSAARHPRRCGRSHHYSTSLAMAWISGIIRLLRPRRLEAQDATLSRWRSPVRIRSGVPMRTAGCSGRRPAVLFAAHRRRTEAPLWPSRISRSRNELRGGVDSALILPATARKSIRLSGGRSALPDPASASCGGAIISAYPKTYGHAIIGRNASDSLQRAKRG